MSTTSYLLDHGLWVILSLGLASIAFFATKAFRHRRFYTDLPTPPHSLFLGNLAVMGEALKCYPPDMHPQPLFTDLATKYDLHGIYYLDLYPFSEPMVFITDPTVAAQIQSDPDTFYRHPFAISFLSGIVGKKSIFSTMGAEWQRQRGWFAPGFSMSYLLTLVPSMVEETLVFKEKLTKFAVSREVFSMNDAAIRLAIDFIGRTVGDIRLRSQTSFSPIQNAFESSIGWTAGQTDPLWKKLLSPLMMWWYMSKLDKQLGSEIQEKFKGRGKEEGLDKSILDLALKGYLKEKGKAGGYKIVQPDQDKEFMQIALDNAKTFFVGGHDTTASMVTYHFYYLSLNPSILTRLRAEHDSIFGSTLDATISALHADPALLNKLPLTQAVFKECLRLHPAGFTIRKAAPGATVVYDGRTYPLENHMIAVLATAMHRDPAYFKNPSVFDPDRFLDPEINASRAWIPFEKGPRNCIGQQLAILEAKVISVLTVRWFDFEAVFKDHGLSVPGYGGRAYQELNLTAKPKDGIPMRATLRKV